MLGKAARGRVNNALASPITLIDYYSRTSELPGRVKAIGPELLPILQQFSVVTAEVYSALLCGTDRNLQKTFVGIDTQGAVQLALLAEKIAGDPQAFERVKFRTVFGASESMPFRAFQYLLPAVQLVEEVMKRYQEVNKSGLGLALPQIEFVFMGEAGILTNNLEREKVYEQQIQFVEIAKKYLQSYHPKVAKAIRFVSDLNFTPQLLESDIFAQTTQGLKDLLPHFPELLTTLLEMGRHSTIDQSLEYAALHMFVHNGEMTSPNIQFSPIDGDSEALRNAQTEYLLSIGAQPERHFFAIRQLSEQVFTNLRKSKTDFRQLPSAQYLTSIQAPPYLALKERLRDKDLSLKNVIEDPKILTKVERISRREGDESEYQTAVQIALASLVKDSGGYLGELITFFQQFSRP